MKTNITVLLINWMYFSYFSPQVRSSALSVKCQLTVNLTDEHNQKSSYVLVSDSDCQMYVIHQGTVVMVIKTPSIITAVSVYLQVKHKIFKFFMCLSYNLPRFYWWLLNRCAVEILRNLKNFLWPWQQPQVQDLVNKLHWGQTLELYLYSIIFR